MEIIMEFQRDIPASQGGRRISAGMDLENVF
jgi:hypothetical protein